MGKDSGTDSTDSTPLLDWSKTPSPLISSPEAPPGIVPWDTALGYGVLDPLPVLPADFPSQTALESSKPLSVLDNTYEPRVESAVRSLRPIPSVVTKTDQQSLDRRARNTEAARRSRNRTKQRIAELESQVARLLVENKRLQSEVDVLKN